MLRRVSYILSAVALIIVIAVAFADREADEERAVAPPLTTPTGPPPRTVVGDLPQDRVIRARTGDLVTVTVTTAEPDEAFVDALGIDVQTSADVPGVIDFVADEPGTYPVELVDAARTIGRIEVTAASRPPA